MALTEDFNKPALANAVATDLEAIRDNFAFCLVAATNGSIVIPGWQTVMASAESPENYSEPDSVTLTKTDTLASPQLTRKIQVNYTWTSGNVTGMVIKFDAGDGAGLVTVTGGTLTLTYDGDGNFTGATSA